MFVFSINSLLSQRLPNEYRFSEDGRRLIRGNQDAKGLYDDKVLKRVDLQFDFGNWQLLLKNHSTKTDLPATLVFEGKSYPNVGLRLKGLSSFYTVNGLKKSFNITMDYLDSTQNLKGYQTLNFHNGAFDDSFIKEVFYENLTRKYGPALKAAFVHLYINGADWGLYPHIQALDGKFIKEWFQSNDGSRWRAESPGFVDKWQPGLTTLKYLGEDNLSYRQNYTLKHSKLPEPWNDLIKFIRILNDTKEPDSLNAVLDVDRTLWFLAKEILFEDQNGYVHGGGMDYYIYYDEETQRFCPLSYDNNSIMDSPKGDWDLFKREKDTLFPLCNKLFNIPAFRQRYLAHVRTLVNDLFRDSVFIPVIDRYFNLIDTVVKKDGKKLMKYEKFVAGKKQLKSWMQSRRNFILSHPEVTRTIPVLSEVYCSADTQPPAAAEKVSVRVSVVNKTTVSNLVLHYCPGYDGAFTRVVMDDNGKNNDELPNDGVYGAFIPGNAAGTYVRYYIEAIANDSFGTVVFEPQGAEHDVYIYRVNPGGVVSKEVVINEVMSANTHVVADQDGEYDDWIELYNTSNKTIDLSKWILTDNPAIPDKYRLPSGTKITPKGYLVIWADEDGKQIGLHANFKISASGESISLKDAKGNIVDHIEIPALQDNQSYAREVNGKGRFVITNPTLNKNNVQVEKSVKN